MIDAPLVNLVSAHASVAAPAGGSEPAPLVEGTVLEGVRLGTSFRLRFDRYLLPESARRQAVCLTASLTPPAALGQCGGIFLEPRYDPVDREVVFYQREGVLAPGVLYWLLVFTPTPETPFAGFRAFDRAPIARRHELRFRTEDADPAAAPREEPPPSLPSGYCSGVRDLLTLTCGTGSCHGGSKPASGLKLDEEAALQETLYRVARQTQVGGASAQAKENPVRFGGSMPIVDRSLGGNPGNSYLLYKLLIGDNFEGGTAPPLEEIERLRASFVLGLPMPASGALTYDELRAVSGWIAAGAPLEACP